MTWTYTDEYYKNYTRDTWNESAPEYGPVRANLDKWNPELLRAARVQAGDRALDVACGDGEPALSLARLGARVVGVDLSERMVELAREAAAREKLDAEFHVMDAEKLTLPDRAFDLVTCRFGLQIVTDPDAAIAETYRVLRATGRLAASVWAPFERCAALHVIIGPMLEFAEPDETGYIPTPYEMGNDGELASILEDAGFLDVEEMCVRHEWAFADEAAFFRGVLKGTPVGHSLSEEDEDVQKQVLAKTRANLQRWTRGDGSIVMPAEAIVVSARRP